MKAAMAEKRAAEAQMQARQYQMLYQGYASSGSLVHSSLIDALRSQRVQKQIDFTADQKKHLDEIRKGLTIAYSKLRKKYPELNDRTVPAEVRKSVQKDINNQYKILREKAEAEFKETLLPHQLKLIRQLKFNEAVQRYGFSWTVSNKPFNEELKTTDEQKKILSQIKQETESAIQKKIAEMRKAAKEKMLKALDRSQKETIKRLEGVSAKEKKVPIKL